MQHMSAQVPVFRRRLSFFNELINTSHLQKIQLPDKLKICSLVYFEV